MKKLIIALIFILYGYGSAGAAILAFSPNGVYTAKATLAEAATAADGAGKTIVVTSALSAVQSNISSATVHNWPSDRKLKVEKGGNINNTTTFRVNGPFEAGTYQAFNGTGNVTFSSSTTVYPQWFGAVADGSHDDSDAIDKSLRSISSTYGGRLYFPRGQYRVTRTIETYNAKGLNLAGDMGTINLSPTIAEGVGDSCIFWDGVGSTTPIFYFEGGHNNTFRGLCIKGKKGTDATNGRAYAGIWIDGNHENYRFYDCKIMMCYIGIRVCSGYNHADNTYLAGQNRYTGVYNAAANANGGYASDNGRYSNCTFGYNTKAGLSIESSQALNMLWDKSLSNRNAYGVFIAACQGMHFDTPTFIYDTAPAIYMTFSSSSGNITVSDAHYEGDYGVLFESVGIGDLGTGISFKTCGGGDVNIAGASGSVSISDSILRTVSIKNAGISLVIKNSTLTSLDKSAGLGNGPLLKLSNVTVTTTLTAHALAYANLDIEKTTLPGWTEFTYVGKRVSGGNNIGPGIMLGAINEPSLANGMEGVSIGGSGNSGFIGWGCYLSSGGIWIATATAGGNMVFNSTGVVFSKFSGATIGDTPTFVQIGAFP